jgi:hypothetical protein
MQTFIPMNRRKKMTNHWFVSTARHYSKVLSGLTFPLTAPRIISEIRLHYFMSVVHHIKQVVCYAVEDTGTSRWRSAYVQLGLCPVRKTALNQCWFI